MENSTVKRDFSEMWKGYLQGWGGILAYATLAVLIWILVRHETEAKPQPQEPKGGCAPCSKPWA